MRPEQMKGPLLLLLLQVMPVQVVQDSSGTLHVTLGYGSGQFERVSYSCNGDPVSSEGFPFQSRGALAEYWWNSGFRISAAAGTAALDTLHSTFGAIQIAREGGRAGVGVGVARTPFDHDRLDGFRPDPVHVSWYLRLGDPEGPHVRFDSYYPTFAPGATAEPFRMGIGFNRMAAERMNAFVGYSFTPFNEGGLFGELTLPVSEQLGITVAGRAQRTYEHPDAGFGVGVRYQLRR